MSSGFSRGGNTERAAARAKALGEKEPRKCEGQRRPGGG